MIFSYLQNMQSHPSWVCGLKHILVGQVLGFHSVTPFVGVWIETALSQHGKANKMSHPSWVCGLKQP